MTMLACECINVSITCLTVVHFLIVKNIVHALHMFFSSRFTLAPLPPHSYKLMHAFVLFVYLKTS